jgi:hypothetical protein
MLLFAKYHLKFLTPAELTTKQTEQDRILQRAEAAEACSKLQLELESALTGNSHRGKPSKSVLPLGLDEIAIYRTVLQHWTAGDKNALHISKMTLPLPLDQISQCECLQGMELTMLLNASRSYHDLVPAILSPNMTLRSEPTNQDRSRK